MDKESELLKIQIYADYLNTQNSTYVSFLFGVLITGVFLGLTVLYEHIFNFVSSTVFMLGIIFAVFAALLYNIRNNRNKMDKIYGEIDALADSNDPSIGDDM
jgi:cytosine/uracil/thiamine/allantoin permease